MRLQLQERSLNDLSKQISEVTDPELKSHLSKYFCVLVSGYVENYIKDLVYNFHDKSCKKETAKFISSKMKNLTNLDDDKIISFLELFDMSWADNYKKNRNGEMEAALNTIYAQRNKIAHGNASNSNISYNSISNYYESIKDVLVVLSLIIIAK